MATELINWGDGTGDEFTVVFSGTTGVSSMDFTSSPNLSGQEREKTVSLAVGAIEFATVMVVQDYVIFFDVLVDDYYKFILDEYNKTPSYIVNK
jgi:hypothetical protein